MDQTYHHHYLPIRDQIFHTGFYVTSAGSGLVRPGGVYPPVQHPPLYHFNWQDGRVLPEFSLLLISTGRGVFESKETGEVGVEPGTVVLLFPGVWHRYRPSPETGWTERWLQFNGEFAHVLLDQEIINPRNTILHPPNFAEIESALDRLLERIAGDPSSNSLLISLHALRVLTLAIGETPLNTPAAEKSARNTLRDPLVAAALDYIWTRSHQVLSVAEVARSTGCTRRTLERRMIAELGHTVLEEIIAVRFNRAERLLCETDLPIKTVVVLAGFGSAENMRQVFVSRTGLAPANYRSQRKNG